jgi:uroporphyrinogen decarboxylase
MDAESRFLRAGRLQVTDSTPVWFMRQAGRYLAEYRKIREKCGLLEMFKTPEIAVEVTLQPLKILPVDAAIIFADILLPLEPMGIALEYSKDEGPVIHNPVRTGADARALRVPDPEEELGYVLSSLRLARAELNGRVPLIGFGGAPFTLASYMIEGGTGRNYLMTKKLMYGEGETWSVLMTKVAQTISRYLLAQVKAGAQVIQLFDSWVGCLSPSDYREYVLPYSRMVFQALEEQGVLSIHFGTGTADLLPWMRQAGGDVIGVDWRTPLDDAWARVGDGAGVQGNLDPATLMAPWTVVRERAREILDRAGGRPGHIFNLGHGILPQTPVDSVKALADFVHEYTSVSRDH